MGDICCGVFSDGDNSSRCDSTSRLARRRRMVIRRVKLGGVDVPPSEAERQWKRPKVKICAGSSSTDCHRSAENCIFEDGKRNKLIGTRQMRSKEISCSCESSSVQVPKTGQSCSKLLVPKNPGDSPKFGTASVCGRRREMEDAVAIHPSFFRRDLEKITSSFHYFGVYDGHGCSHVSSRCRERLHELVKEELDKTEPPVKEWKNIMEWSFQRMDEEVLMSNNQSSPASKCRCQPQSQQYDAVGSTAVVSIITSDKFIVANCGDSRAVLCRNGQPLPLSSDHRPDRPDELSRIRAAGGRVIYWDGPRVLGVLAVSRAIGDNYLKPYVICEPEVTSTDRKEDDEFLILGSDGLWDVVSNETACRMVLMCLGGKRDEEATSGIEKRNGGEETADETCTEASMVLTKLALARGSSDNISVVVVDVRRDTWDKKKEGFLSLKK